MFKYDAIEAKPIVDVTLDALLGWTATRGRTGADLRTIVGDVKAHAISLLQSDIMGDALIKCFEASYWAGITLQQMDYVRSIAAAQPAKSVGAIMTRDTLIQLALSIEGDIIANTFFLTRDDVVTARKMTNASFEVAEEQIADKMDSMTYRALVQVHAAISMYLYEVARPLPRMLNFRFMQTLPSLVLAHKLYYDASRADEIRDENKIVHPTFMRRFGRALSQ